jgi:hypothetical protein
MARERRPSISGMRTTTYKSISISLDEETFGRVLLSENVVLKAVCPPSNGSLELVLKNKVGGRIKPRGSETVVIEADEETFIGLVSPTMKVRFEGDSFSVPFQTEKISSKPMFSIKPPLVDAIKKN